MAIKKNNKKRRHCILKNLNLINSDKIIQNIDNFEQITNSNIQNLEF